MKAGCKVKPLGDVCEFRRGLTYGKGDEVEAGGVAVLRAMNIDLATGELDLNDSGLPKRGGGGPKCRC